MYCISYNADAAAVTQNDSILGFLDYCYFNTSRNKWREKNCIGGLKLKELLPCTLTSPRGAVLAVSASLFLLLLHHNELGMDTEPDAQSAAHHLLTDLILGHFNSTQQLEDDLKVPYYTHFLFLFFFHLRLQRDSVDFSRKQHIYPPVFSLPQKHSLLAFC